MLLRYPGNGNSIPSACTVATSVPFPPVGPPPAFGATVFAGGLVLASATVLVVGAEAAFPLVGGARGGVFGPGVGVGDGIPLSHERGVAGRGTGGVRLPVPALRPPV